MDRSQLRGVVYKVVMRMVSGELSHAEEHRALVKAAKLEAPGVSGRKIWSSLTFIIYILKMRCKHRLLWRNRFSLVGVHGKGSRRLLEYHPEACGSCDERLECMIIDFESIC